MTSDRINRKLGVLTLVDGVGEYGGTERIAREIALHLDPDQFESYLCVSRRIPPEEAIRGREALAGTPVRLLELNRSSRADLAAWVRLGRFMRRQQIDVLHSHKFGSNLWGAILARIARVPVFISHEHTWSFEGQPLRKMLDRYLIAASADAFLAVSEADRVRMIELEGIDAAKVMYVPNGIPDPPSLPQVQDLRSELGIGPEAPLVGIVAVVRQQKAHEVLIESGAILSKEFPDLAVVIIGDDEVEGARIEALRAQAAQLGAPETFHFLGKRGDVPRLIAELDLAVLTSDYEGSPLSVMEYMAAARPVVATDVGGVGDLVVSGETGYLVPPRDPAAFAEAMAWVLRDPAKARDMGEAGRRRQQAQYSLAATVSQIEALYRQLRGPVPD